MENNNNKPLSPQTSPFKDSKNTKSSKKTCDISEDSISDKNKLNLIIVSFFNASNLKTLEDNYNNHSMCIRELMCQCADLLKELDSSVNEKNNNEVSNKGFHGTSQSSRNSINKNINHFNGTHNNNVSGEPKENTVSTNKNRNYYTINSLSNNKITYKTHDNKKGNKTKAKDNLSFSSNEFNLNQSMKANVHENNHGGGYLPKITIDINASIDEGRVSKKSSNKNFGNSNIQNRLKTKSKSKEHFMTKKATIVSYETKNAFSSRIIKRNKIYSQRESYNAIKDNLYTDNKIESNINENNEKKKVSFKGEHNMTIKNKNTRNKENELFFKKISNKPHVGPKMRSMSTNKARENIKKFSLIPRDKVIKEQMNDRYGSNYVTTTIENKENDTSRHMNQNNNTICIPNHNINYSMIRNKLNRLSNKTVDVIRRHMKKTSFSGFQYNNNYLNTISNSRRRGNKENRKSNGNIRVKIPLGFGMGYNSESELIMPLSESSSSLLLIQDNKRVATFKRRNIFMKIINNNANEKIIQTLFNFIPLKQNNLKNANWLCRKIYLEKCLEVLNEKINILGKDIDLNSKIKKEIIIDVVRKIETTINTIKNEKIM